VNTKIAYREISSRNHPLVSVIIPARNEEQYLGRCLESVFQVNYPTALIEVIVVDNNSVDDTANLAIRYGAKVISSGAQTIGALRNEGARHAKGEILAFIDADIVVDRDWLAKAVVHFEKDSVGAVGACPIPDYENLTLVEDLWDRMLRPPSDGTHLVNYLPSGNLLVRAAHFQTIGGFDEQMETCEDPDLGFRLGKIAELVEDRSVRAVHLRNPKNFTGFLRKEFWHGKGLIRGFLKYRDNINALPSLLAPIAYLMILIVFAASLFIGPKIFVLFGLLALLLPLLYCVRSCRRSRNYSKFISFYYLHFLYLLARSMAIAAELFHRLKAGKYSVNE
jgi:glycosyltransferase involved in cell wall biosynthesis